jgi:hypothetical protein
MPTFEFTSPEGKKYRIQGPDGSTKEQAFGVLQQQLGAAPAAAQSPGDQVPGGGQAGNRNAGKPDTNDEGILKRIAGLGETALAAGTGAIAAPAGALAAVAKTFKDGKYGQQDQAAEDFGGKVAQALTYQPRTQTGANLSQMVGNIAERSGVAGLALPELNAAASTAGAVRAAAAPAIQATADAGAAAAGRVGASLSQLAGKVVPRIDPVTARLAAKAQEQYGIPLRPDQLYGNKLAKMAGEASEKVPLSGSKGDARQEAFNKAIIGTIGGDQQAAKLTPDVFDQAIRASGQKIGDIAAKTPLMIDSDLSKALDSHLANVAKYETPDVARVITSYIDDLRSKAVDGAVPGEAFRKLNTKINTQMRSTGNGDLKHALGELQDDLQDSLQRGLSGDDLAALQVARQQYGIAKTIEPLVAKSATGDISPAGLMGRVTANNAGKARMARGNGGDLGDLARIGQRFLKEPPSSGTAERGLVYGLAGGGVVAEPASAAGVYALSNLYNRTGAAVARKLTPNLKDLAGKGGN